MSHGLSGLSVLAVCGWSGSGKTTLLEAVIPRLRGRGLEVAVIKHDVHGVELDRPGKDSDRLFRAGADVLLQGANESAARYHPRTAPGLVPSIRALAASHDLVLVEGHRDTPLPKLWLLSEGQLAPPTQVPEIRAVLPSNGDRVGAALDAIIEFSDMTWRARTLRAGILVGGDSTRMGRPKQLLELEGRSFAVRLTEVLVSTVGEPVLLGSGPAPQAVAGLQRLPDAPDLQGPAAGLAAALRWDPDAAWLVVGCDQPLLESAAVMWLLGERRPGRWAVLPRTAPDTVEPLFATYEPQSAVLLADAVASGRFGPLAIADHPRVSSPEPPAELVHCWRSIDRPEDYREISG